MTRPILYDSGSAALYMWMFASTGIRHIYDLCAQLADRVLDERVRPTILVRLPRRADHVVKLRLLAHLAFQMHGPPEQLGECARNGL